MFEKILILFGIILLILCMILFVYGYYEICIPIVLIEIIIAVILAAIDVFEKEP